MTASGVLKNLKQTWLCELAPADCQTIPLPTHLLIEASMDNPVLKDVGLGGAESPTTGVIV